MHISVHAGIHTADWVFILDVDFVPSANLPIALSAASGFLAELWAGASASKRIPSPPAFVIAALSFRPRQAIVSFHYGLLALFYRSKSK